MAVSVRTELKSKANADGTHTVSIRYTANREHRREGLLVPVRIAKKDYNPRGVLGKDNWIRATCPQHATYNRLIKERMEFIYGVVEEMEKEGRPVTAGEIEKELGRRKAVKPENGYAAEKGQTAPCFLEFFQQEVDRIAKSQQRHADNVQATLNKFRKFVKRETLPFEEVTVRLAKDYYAWELAENKVSTCNKSLERLGRVYDEAVNEEIVNTANPFDKVKRLKASRPVRRRLTREEIGQITGLRLDPSQRPFHVRNIFLVQFYIHGMRIGDAMTLKVGDFSRVDGRLRLEYTMEKTEAGVVGFEVVEQAERIIGPYLEGKEPGQFVFPFLSDEVDYTDKYFLERQIESKTAYCNRVIKDVMRKAGIKDPDSVTTHVARHSFADLARRSGADVYDISKGLRHGSIRITEYYLASFDDEAVNSLNFVYENQVKTGETTVKQSDGETNVKQN